jgi:spore coat polysaccharide biosynthesis protein SpsF
MRVTAVIQARAGSSRLPGKVLLDLGGRSVLGWVVRAAQEASQVDHVVIATSSRVLDDPVEAAARELGVPCVRGSEDDVLSRFEQALADHPSDAVVRLTADCPLLDPRLIDAVVAVWRAVPERDYVSTVLVRTLPRGLDVEVVAAGALRRVSATAEAHDRVHVTSGIYADPQTYDVLGVCAAPDASDLRVTLDTAQDYELLKAVVAQTGDRPGSLRDIVALLRARPDLVALNADVEQKALEEG